MTTTTTPARFRDQTIVFAKGVTGRNLDVSSASPLNYHQALFRLFGGAAHSFDKRSPLVRIADARVAPGGPTAYLAADGAYVHPLTGRADPTLTDRDVAVYNLKAGYGVRGATLGGTDAEAAEFRADMLAFWSAALGA